MGSKITKTKVLYGSCSGIYAAQVYGKYLVRFFINAVRIEFIILCVSSNYFRLCSELMLKIAKFEY